jgi:hypothetical protein
MVLVAHNHRVPLVVSTKRIGGGAFQRMRRIAPLHALDGIDAVKDGDGLRLLQIDEAQVGTHGGFGLNTMCSCSSFNLSLKTLGISGMPVLIEIMKTPK